jgi:nucleoside-diphosphate-sugar epimerase
MRIFVAGGTGVIGKPSVKELVTAGHQVRSTARGADKTALVRAMGAEAIDADLYDEVALRRAIAGCDAVVRLTTKISSLMKLGRLKTWDETNRLRTAGARMLVNAAIAERASVYIHESITFVYRDGGAAWLDETTPVDDAASPILRAALEGEREAERFSQAGGRGIVLRFAGFYGPQAPSTIEMAALLRKRFLFQFGAASNYFSSAYLPDAGRAVARAVGIPAGIYNVCDDEPVSFAEYLGSAAAALGAPRPRRLPGFLGPFMFGAVWNYFSRSHRISNARLKSVTNWRPTVRSVHDGWPLVAALLSAPLGSTTAVAKAG